MSRMRQRLQRVGLYTGGVLAQAWPRSWSRRACERTLAGLSSAERAAVDARVAYYCRIDAPFQLPPEHGPHGAISAHDKSAYVYDFRAQARPFPRHLRIAWRFGDKTFIPEVPSVVKARPVGPAHTNANSVLLKLDRIRHYQWIRGDRPFRTKQPLAVWRGSDLHPQRSLLVERWGDHPLTNIGSVPDPKRGRAGTKGYLTQAQQLEHQFLISIEGNDVATNLKWILSSHSLCLMPRPKFETWFMEGRLQSGVHYVELDPDLSNLEAVIEHYRAHPEEAEAIIANAHAWVAPFKNTRLEKATAMLVLQRYFTLSGQEVSR